MALLRERTERRARLCHQAHHVLTRIGVIGVILIAAPARSSPCEPVRIVIEAPSVSTEWRTALEALSATTSDAGHLWSCAGGELLIVLTSRNDALLRRRDALGRQATRHVPGPDDLVPMAEALLALSGARDAGPAPRPLAAPPVASAVHTVLPHRDPRLVAEVLANARYGGTLRSVWGGGVLRISVPIEAWSVGAWVRYSIPYVFDDVPSDFSLSDVCVGLSIGRRLLTAGPLELAATFDPSIAFVSMEAGESDAAEGAKLDGRLGGALRAAFRWTRVWRGLIALDGELAPASLAKPRRIAPTLPPLPAYSIGASIGVGASLP